MTFPRKRRNFYPPSPTPPPTSRIALPLPAAPPPLRSRPPPPAARSQTQSAVQLHRPPSSSALSRIAPAAPLSRPPVLCAPPPSVAEPPPMRTTASAPHAAAASHQAHTRPAPLLPPVSHEAAHVSAQPVSGIPALRTTPRRAAPRMPLPIPSLPAPQQSPRGVHPRNTRASIPNASDETSPRTRKRARSSHDEILRVLAADAIKAMRGQGLTPPPRAPRAADPSRRRVRPRTTGDFDKENRVSPPQSPNSFYRKIGLSVDAPPRTHAERVPLAPISVLDDCVTPDRAVRHKKTDGDANGSITPARVQAAKCLLSLLCNK